MIIHLRYDEVDQAVIEDEPDYPRPIPGMQRFDAELPRGQGQHYSIEAHRVAEGDREQTIVRRSNHASLSRNPSRLQQDTWVQAIRRMSLNNAV